MSPAAPAHPRDDPDHLLACPACRAEVATVSDVGLGRVWLAVAAEVWATPIGPVERLAGRLLGSPALARALVATPSLVLSWIIASAIVLAVGALATRDTGTPWPALLAPALAGCGIAYAYGPGCDPAFELAQTMAVPDRVILLVRGLAVFGVNALLGLVASLFATGLSGLTLGWLVPMAAVSALALAVATLAHSANVGVAAALLGWAFIVVAGLAGTGDLAAAVSGWTPTPLYLLGTVCGIIVTLHATSGRRNGGLNWQR